MREHIKKELLESVAVKLKVADLLLDHIAGAVQAIEGAYRRGNKLLLAGNGGSAADAQHIAAEFVVRYKLERPSLHAVALTTDSSILTATGNDYSFDHVFSRALNGLGVKGDVFMAISTSGNSKNIIEAVLAAKAKGIFTIGLIGKDGGRLKELADLAIVVPSNETERIQESHITIGHIISNLVEKRLFGNGV